MKRIFFSIVMAGVFSSSAFSQVIYVDDAGERKENKEELFQHHHSPEVRLKSIPVQQVKLRNSLFSERYALNKKYLMSLENDKLLQNFYYEAGISKTGNITVNKDGNYQDFYWGWESPSNQLRGHFLGHWLSAAAYIYAETGDKEVKEKADRIVAELAVCQENNGGEWVGSIPEKYLYLMAEGKNIWSPQYTLHKTLMGLYDMYMLTGSQQALDVLDRFADWFHRWTGELVEAGKAHAIYGGETSGMLEIWANMYALTQNVKYRDLMERYGQPGLFQALEKGEDALSNDHANASIPWSHGAARLYEVTGNEYWKQMTLAFWKCAVLDRESFCTGGQNAGEFWIPPHQLHHFIGENNQEHCTVYNMIRTADYLYRWTGDVQYADYIERNIYNGLLAQQHPRTGMVAYFLPMGAGYTKGGEKGWGHPTMDFYCCHGSLVQAQTRYLEYIYFESAKGLVVSQYIPSELSWKREETDVHVQQDFTVSQFNKDYAGSRWKMQLKVNAEKPVHFDLCLRLPWWLKEKAIIKVNGQPEKVNTLNGYHIISRTWQNDEVYIEFPTCLYAEPLPGSEDMIAYMEGPIVLAGLCGEETMLHVADKESPESILMPEYGQEYKIVRWKQSHYRTSHQEKAIRFVPLYEIGDEPYTIYFPMQKEKR